VSELAVVGIHEQLSAEFVAALPWKDRQHDTQALGEVAFIARLQFG
jgi:hypothetical protein